MNDFRSVVGACNKCRANRQMKAVKESLHWMLTCMTCKNIVHLTEETFFRLFGRE